MALPDGNGNGGLDRAICLVLYCFGRKTRDFEFHDYEASEREIMGERKGFILQTEVGE